MFGQTNELWTAGPALTTWNTTSVLNFHNDNSLIYVNYWTEWLLTLVSSGQWDLCVWASTEIFGASLVVCYHSWLTKNQVTVWQTQKKQNKTKKTKMSQICCWSLAIHLKNAGLINENQLTMIGGRSIGASMVTAWCSQINDMLRVHQPKLNKRKALEIKAYVVWIQHLFVLWLFVFVSMVSVATASSSAPDKGVVFGHLV